MNLLDQGEKRLICQILFLQYLTKALLAEGLCVEKLVSAASGIRMFGFLRARISQMELAPALEIIRSEMANRSFNWALTYSYWT